MESYDLNELNVLVVDRNQHMLTIIKQALEDLGVERLWATDDPDYAFQLFEANGFDLIISDWVPGRDEMQFLNRIRDPAKSPNPYIPIIVITVYSELRNVLAARDLGMTEFMTAPVSAKGIYEHIRAAIDGRRPFIKRKDFFGPDRRRHQNNKHPGPDRRQASSGEDALGGEGS